MKRSTTGWVPAAGVFISGPGRDIKCPRCGNCANTGNALKTCAGCGAPWRERRGRYEFLIGLGGEVVVNESNALKQELQGPEVKRAEKDVR